MRIAEPASASAASTLASCGRLAIALAIACAGLAGADACAAEPPVLKSGLWELSRSAGAQSDTKRLTTMCLDDSVQAQMRECGLGMAKELCSKSDRRFEGDRLIIERVEPRYWPKLAFITRITGLRELVTWNCVIRVRKR